MIPNELLRAILLGNVYKFYKSGEWIRKRKEILKRDKNECQVCKNKGKVHKGECVHHIKHLKESPMLGLTSSNLITLCYVCHNVEHPEKLHNKVKKRFMNEEKWE